MVSYGTGTRQITVCFLTTSHPSFMVVFASLRDKVVGLPILAMAEGGGGGRRRRPRRRRRQERLEQQREDFGAAILVS
jgi:hypothetical protein